MKKRLNYLTVPSPAMARRFSRGSGVPFPVTSDFENTVMSCKELGHMGERIILIPGGSAWFVDDCSVAQEQASTMATGNPQWKEFAEVCLKLSG